MTAARRMNDGIPSALVLTLLGMCATGIVFLFGVAQGIRSWVEKKFRERDEDWKVEKTTMAQAFGEQIATLNAAMKEDRSIALQAFEKVHTRISERIEADDYYREQQRTDKRLEEQGRSIENLASSIRHRVDTMQQTITAQGGIHESTRREMDVLQGQQREVIGSLRKPAAE